VTTKLYISNGFLKAVIGMFFALSNIVAAQEQAIIITVSDGVNHKELTVGVHPDGQSSFVQGLDQFAPPPPPSGAFDARLIVENESYFKKFLEKTPGEKRFEIRYRKESGNESIHIIWEENELFNNAVFRIEDIFGGQFYSGSLTELDESFEPSALHSALAEGLVFIIDYEVTTSLDQSIQRPAAFTLHQNYPNPFNPSTNIAFDLHLDTPVKISVFTLNGRLVQKLFDGFKNEGQHLLSYDGSNLASGIYLLEIRTNYHTDSIKMNLIK